LTFVEIISSGVFFATDNLVTVALIVNCLSVYNNK